MENRPIGREMRIVSGGNGIKRSGKGLGKDVSERNIKKEEPNDEPKKNDLPGETEQNQ